MRKAPVGALVLCWIVCGAGSRAVQPPMPQVFVGAPAALWIFPPGVAGDEFGVFHFRRVFDLDASPSRFVVHVSADNRYRLFVNGKPVSSGPQRSDLMHLHGPSWGIRSSPLDGSTATSRGLRTCGRSTGAVRGSAPGRPISTRPTTSSCSTWVTPASRR